MPVARNVWLPIRVSKPAPIDAPPDFGPPGWRISGGDCSGGRASVRASHQLDRGLVTDRAVKPDFVGVSTPSPHLGLRVVKAHEPVGVQALGSELAVEAFDEGVPA